MRWAGRSHDRKGAALPFMWELARQARVCEWPRTLCLGHFQQTQCNVQTHGFTSQSTSPPTGTPIWPALMSIRQSRKHWLGKHVRAPYAYCVAGRLWAR